MLNSNDKLILITGATGFVGKVLCAKAISQGFHVKGTIRADRSLIGEVEKVFIDTLGDDTDWTAALRGVNVAIHLAARAHVMRDDVENPMAEFRRLNTMGTVHLARSAAAIGVKRLVYVSSIKVNGEETFGGQSYTERDMPVPRDAYGISKFEAEQGLLHIAHQTGMEVVIIRPPLVYGPGVKANFASMMEWVDKGVPLPLGAVHNKRSLVALDNLVSFIVHCIDHPKAANEIFLISDGEDVSTTELIKKTAKALGKRPLLIPVPVSLMKFAAKLIGKEDIANRLFGSLQVDSSKARELLGWKPVITMDGQLKKTADACLNEKAV